MEHRRRQLGLGPGEHLLLPSSALDTVGRLRRWNELTGLDDGDVLLSPLSAAPLPMPWTVPAGHRRWPALRPDALWHPLLWLPRRLRGPQSVLDGATGLVRTETYDDWAVRVVLELTEAAPVVIEGQRWVLLHDPANGRHVRPAGPQDDALVPLYDAATGTWLDVLSTVGLDVDDPADLSRVRGWLDGAPDDALDAVDLDRHLTAVGRDPAWSLDRAHRPHAGPGGTRTYVEDLRDASSALVARELDDEAARLGSAGASAREVGRRTGVLARLASTLLSPRDDVAQDLGLALGIVTANAERATAPASSRTALADLRSLLGSVVETASVGLDQVAARVELETDEVLGQVRALAEPTVS